MRFVVTIAAACFAFTATAAAADDVAAEATRSVTVRARAEPAALKAGAAGKLHIVIEPSGAFHVDPKTPLKVTLEPTVGLTLAKAQLGKGDASPVGKGMALEGGFTAASAGPQEVKAKVDFFVCSDQACIKQVRELTVAIKVL